MEEKRVLEILARVRAVLKDGHFVYASGRHGSEYVDKDRVYRDPGATDELCQGIAEHFRGFNVEVVVAPVQGGINLSQGVARHLVKMTGQEVVSIYADKEGEELILRRGYDKDIPGKRVLAVDDVFTTGGSVKKLVEIVRALGGEIVGVGGLCNRGSVKNEDIGGVPEFFTLTSVQMATYDEAVCPLCAKGVSVNTEIGEGAKYLARKAKAV